MAEKKGLLFEAIREKSRLNVFKVKTPEQHRQSLRRTSEKLWTTNLWIYDFRTNQHFTLIPVNQ